jgi:hypothetical protein
MLGKFSMGIFEQAKKDVYIRCFIEFGSGDVDGGSRDDSS